MIIHTGMRTDIPAFYSEWFYNRIKEGYVLVRNPYNMNQVTRYNLSKEVVDLIGFCTKNPGPMLSRMKELEGYGQYWFVTITPYGKDIEPGVPDKDIVLEDFKCLSDIVGIDSVGWRYDPIFLNDTYTLDRHLKDFEHMAKSLEGYTRTCVISFIDLYDKVLRNFPEVKSVRKEERLYLGEQLVRIAANYGLTIKPCGEGDELSAYGADCSGCMTLATYEKAIGHRLLVPKSKNTNARKECACYLSGDIGSYNSCMHGCRYCYANVDQLSVKRNFAMHDPKSPFLIGGPMPDDIIHMASQKSYIDRQMSIFDFL